MHSSLNRLQVVFGFFTTVSTCVAACIAISVLLFPQTPSGSLELRNVQVARGRPHYYSTKKEEYANIRFDLDLDLTSLYSWNTKQVFVYILASYPPTKKGDPPSQVVIWDAVLPAKNAASHPNQYVRSDPPSGGKKSSKASSKKKAQNKPEQKALDVPGLLKLDNQRPKYQITDRSGLIAEKTNATLSLGWNVQPWVGGLSWMNKKSFGRWKGQAGGQSKPFDFPALPAKREGAASGSPAQADMKTAAGREANKLVG